MRTATTPSATAYSTITLSMPQSDTAFVKAMAKRMGWTIEKKKKTKARLYDPETGEYLNDKTMKVIEDVRSGKEELTSYSSFDEFVKAMRAL